MDRLLEELTRDLAGGVGSGRTNASSTAASVLQKKEGPNVNGKIFRCWRPVGLGLRND